MIKGQDIVVLLKLAAADSDWTLRSLESDLGISRPGIHRSIGRLDEAGLYDAKRRRSNAGRAEEFLVHSVKYLFPARMGGESRGVATAWAAPPLDAKIEDSSSPAPVWPDPHGSVRGIAVAPLHDAASAISRSDPALGEYLFLIDGLRLGDARVRGVAARLLSERLTRGVAA